MCRKRVLAQLAAGLFAAATLPALALDPAAAPVVPAQSLERTCELLGDRLDSISTEDCLHAGLATDGGYSVNGLPILMRDFMPAERTAKPRRVLLIGGIHGDELSAVSTVFQWMKRMGSDRAQPFHWRVVPCLNPDGVLRRPATRVNSRGVDLNRNFMTPDWKSDALAYWEQRTRRDPRRYPGEAPLSEPESRWLVEAMKSFKPDAIVSIHAPYGVLDYDGPKEPPNRFGYLHLHQLGTYPGSLGNFAGTYLGLPMITLELPHAGLMPTATQSQRIWNDMLGWLETNLPKYEPARFQRIDQPWGTAERR
jgi:protein MpaA